MNNLYFACHDCKIYVNAGYRWAYWELEDIGVVTREEVIDVNAVLAAKGYWHPPEGEESRWLREDIFPYVMEFLSGHRNHKMTFGSDEDFAPDFDKYYLEWMEIGHRPRPNPRYLVEKLGLRTWDEVCDFMEKQSIPPGWWDDTWSSDPSPREKGRLKFEELVESRHGS